VLGEPLRACLKSRIRGHVMVGVMTISIDVEKLYDTDLTDAAWALIAPMLPAARPGGRPRKMEVLQRFASGVKILALQKSIVPKCLRIKGRVFGKTATSASFYARSEKLQHFPGDPL
jgi:hypothetical protein